MIITEPHDILELKLKPDFINFFFFATSETNNNKKEGRLFIDLKEILLDFGQTKRSEYYIKTLEIIRSCF
jgi:hypothetical protein